MANGIARSPTAISATARDTTNRLVTFCKLELRHTAQQTRTFPSTARMAITTSRTIYASWECFIIFPSSSVHFLCAFIPQLLDVYLVNTCLLNHTIHGRVIMSAPKRKCPPQTTVALFKSRLWFCVSASSCSATPWWKWKQLEFCLADTQWRVMVWKEGTFHGSEAWANRLQFLSAIVYLRKTGAPFVFYMHSNTEAFILEKFSWYHWIVPSLQSFYRLQLHSKPSQAKSSSGQKLYHNKNLSDCC